MTTYTFTGATDGTLLEDYAPDFSKIEMSNACTITIVGGKLDFNYTSAGSGSATWVVETGSVDHSCEIVYGSNYTSNFFPCVIRVVDFLSYVAARIGTGNILQLFSVVNNVQELIYSRSVARTDADAIKLEAEGEDFRLYFNGSLEESEPGSGYTAKKITSFHDASTLAGLNVRSSSRASAVSSVTIEGVQGEPDPDPIPEIDPTGTDTTIANGSSQQISFTGLTATPTSASLAYGVNVFEQPNFSIGAVTEGVATANFTAAIGNLPYTSAAYPASGFSYLVAGDNGTELTLSGITIDPSADRSVVTAVNPVNDSFSIIPSWVEGGAVTGDQIDWPKVVGNIEPTVNPDFSHRGDRIDKNIPWPDSIKFTVNYWDSITSIRYAVTVEVAYAEDGTGTVIGITTRELTTRSLTVRNLTMRSL